MHDWIQHMNKSYTDLYGGKLKVFRLDKVATKKHEIYIEEDSSTGRIYLNPFDIRSLHNDNKWMSMLGSDMYSEQENVQTFFMNFQDMVQKISDLRKRHIANLYIEYIGNGTPTIRKRDNIITIWADKIKFLEFDLSDRRYSTIRKLANQINDYDSFNCQLEGENDLSRNIVNFERTTFQNRKVLIYTEDTSYKNVSDVIEIGDAILTNKYRLYEVISASPAGEFGWEYVTWKLDCQLASPEKFNLPGNYIEQIKKNEYGLRTKLDME